MKTEIAVFGGGCFWCTEAVFKMIKGVKNVLPGYAGGTTKSPTYEEVSSGNTGHIECTKVEFNPNEISYKDLLTVFFASHDPTTLNRQGNDIGTQYASAIFYTTPKQKIEAATFIDKLNASNKEGRKIVTEIRPLDEFYVAENYHQNYYEHHKDTPYCQIVINPKQEKVQKQFKRLLHSSPERSEGNKDNKAQATTEQELKKKLTPEEYAVLREKGTEPPFSGKLLHDDRTGTYKCKVCGNPLFTSDAKFDSGTGWPSFDQAISGAVSEKPDNQYNMHRTEITCAKYGSHLGHVFNDGPTETGKRYCLNSVCLDLEEKK